MTLDELKKVAEQATDLSPSWFDDIELSRALHRADITVDCDNDARFISVFSPATVLKLLEMISVLRAGIIIAGTRLADRRDDPLNVGAGLQAYYDKTDEIERTL